MKTASKAVGLIITVAGLTMNSSAQTVTASVGAEYTSGDYGGGGDTDIIYVPFSLGVESGDWYARASLPYLDISGPGIFLGDNIPIARDRDTPIRALNENVSGLGDLSLTIGRGFTLDEAGAWHLDITGRVKLPTADSASGLSTGETDYAVALDLTRDVGDWSWFAGGGYRINGDPQTFSLQNTAFASLGAVRYATNGGSWGVAYDFGQAATSGTSDAHELSSWFVFRLTGKTRLQIYGLTGLSDGGPDYGGGLRLSFKL